VEKSQNNRERVYIIVLMVFYDKTLDFFRYVCYNGSSRYELIYRGPYRCPFTIESSQIQHMYLSEKS